LPKRLPKTDPAASERLAREASAYRRDVRRAFAETMARSPVVPLGDGTWCPTAPPWAEGRGPLFLYADTGNFTHENVEYADFQVASLCLQHGASLPLVHQFLRPLAEQHQLALFHETLNHLAARSYGGHLVQLCFLELDRQSAGLAAVVEQVFEV
jgi:hypothetical protein